MNKEDEEIEDFLNSNFDDIIAQDLSEITGHQLVKEEDPELIQSNIVEVDSHNVQDKDFATARANIMDITRRGPDVLSSMISLAQASDHPRAFEVVATLMKTLSDVNKDLLDIHEKKKKLDGNVSNVENQTNNVSNTLMVGTTAELLEMIKDGTSK